MKKFWLLYWQLPWERKTHWSGAALAFTVIAAAQLLMPAEPAAPAARAAPPVDTHIPKAHVLIPIEVFNYEALDSILGKFGLVDLYQGHGDEGAKQVLVARNVRLLRAPQNPSHFAVLVHEREAGEILKHALPFTVIVKRPEASGTEIVKTPSKRRIIYEGE